MNNFTERNSKDVSSNSNFIGILPSHTHMQGFFLKKPAVLISIFLFWIIIIFKSTYPFINSFIKDLYVLSSYRGHKQSNTNFLKKGRWLTDWSMIPTLSLPSPTPILQRVVHVVCVYCLGEQVVHKCIGEIEILNGKRIVDKKCLRDLGRLEPRPWHPRQLVIC